jgi:MoxR-like ATPase
MSLTTFSKRTADKTVVQTEVGEDRERGRDYVFDDALETAVNVALTINRPLLVTGEPGSGKTELGYAIARKLPNVDHVFLFTVKSNSEAKDLFYQFDALGRFHAAQVWATASRTFAPIPDNGIAAPITSVPDIDPLRFLRYRALGRAILMSYGRADVERLLPNPAQFPERPTRSVVIIDEIDKATQDFANDLLFELDQYRFEIPEISAGRDLMATPEKRPSREHLPIIVVTANSDKLPPAFLRRCVFHDIQMDPVRDAERFQSIVLTRLRRSQVPNPTADAAMRLALDVFARARELNLEPKVSVAELLDAAFVACAGLEPGGPPFSISPRLREGIVKSLVKSQSGQEQMLSDRNADLWQPT